MSAVIRVFWCRCGKAHCCAYVSQSSVCACGAALYQQMWRNGR